MGDPAQEVVIYKATKKGAKHMKESFPDKHRPTASFDEITSHLVEGQDLAKRMEVEQQEATWIVQSEYPDLPIAFTFMTDIHYGGNSMRLKSEALDLHKQYPVLINLPYWSCP